ncbi:MAG: hypothetical protein ACOYXB_10405 [Bacteroidota bacterium]
MSKGDLYTGNSVLHAPAAQPGWDLVTEENGEQFFRITDVDSIPPFLMSIVSNSDHWMFISSTGGVTAGRKNPDLAIFPYSTDDKVHESHHHTGSHTVIRVMEKDRVLLWEPFSPVNRGIWLTGRNLYKNTTGNKVIFEEINHSLGLSFRYTWMNSEKFGWVRKCRLENRSERMAVLSILDGLRNILPYGITKNTQEQMSTLMDAYKRNELEPATGMGIFGMSSIPVDRAEPSEALKATVVWCNAVDVKAFLLSEKQCDQFRYTGEVQTEKEKNGIRGAYLVVRDLELKPGTADTWYFIADVARDHPAMIWMLDEINSGRDFSQMIEEDVEDGLINLKAIAARVDGIQQCSDPLVSSRHFSNVLFNVMRGGIFAHDYLVETSDFRAYLDHFNPALVKKLDEWLNSLPGFIPYPELNRKAQANGEPGLIRLTLEYLPLTFSRRHGDPSRPWNRFSINVRNEDGSLSLDYQGNWRDIFQNWEALAYSYPGFLPGMIARFLNATTADGYNPYRITRDGIDWEVFDPADPWSFIGYWGDHQVIYLLRLLELSEKFTPGQLAGWLDKEWFAFANVPYRIKPYHELIHDPVSTILFDEKLHETISAEVHRNGADARLLKGKNGEPAHATLTEKLLVTILTKLSNFIAGGGIWLNTQRPEWNDANNALVGYGVSMVTTYYLHRFIPFLEKLFRDDPREQYSLSPQLITFLHETTEAFAGSDARGAAGSGKIRKELCDKLGMAGSRYREAVYKAYPLKKNNLRKKEILDLFGQAMVFIKETIRVSERKDGLYQAYNLIEINDKEIAVLNLQEMLEGQVALLSSGYLKPEQAVKLLNSLRNSSLYRKDQNSYMLYPAKSLPGMLEKNRLPAAMVQNSPLVRKVLDMPGQKILFTDIRGDLHFNGEFRNAGYLSKEAGKIKALNEKDRKELLKLYEEQFHHRYFTGRSGSFFKYEGLGSIYWHMVAKLVLAVAELAEEAEVSGTSSQVREELKKHFHEIKEGIGLHKSPAAYGAFPTDPYSHTPAMYGAQQPGMTGQVKEDVISRMKELGIRVENGELSFRPVLLNEQEYLRPHSGTTPYITFSICGVPVEYRQSGKTGIVVGMNNHEEIILPQLTIPAELSRDIFNRNGNIQHLTIYF